MAVVRIDENGKRIHHRNPSGFINKIKYLLSESKRDISKLHHIVDYEIDYSNSNCLNWQNAASIAFKIITSPIPCDTVYTENVFEEFQKIHTKEGDK